MEPASRRALSESARIALAERGPGAVTLRQVAAQSGCSHPLVARYFGSKRGLEQAVVEQLAERVATIVARLDGDPTERLTRLLHALRAEPVDVKLLVRCALGDLDVGPPTQVIASFSEMLVGLLEAQIDGRPDPATPRACVAAFIAMSLAFGWLTLDRFLVAGTGTGAVPVAELDEAMGEAAGFVASTYLDQSIALREPSLAAPPADEVTSTEGDDPARRRLVEAAADLFAERGPIASSTRLIAERAGVGQRVIYRHFESKELLLSEALDAVWSPAYAAAVASDGVDVDLLVALVRQHPRGGRIMARALVDGVDVDQMRSRFPIIEGGLGLFDRMPGGGLLGPSDPRVAVAASVALALGSVIWEPTLRTATGIDPGIAVDRALAHAARSLLERAKPSRPMPSQAS